METDADARSNRRFRYSTLQSTLQGLWIFLYEQRRSMEAVFHVEDGGQRLMVGFGKVWKAGNPGPYAV